MKKKHPVRVIEITATFKNGTGYKYSFEIVHKKQFFTARSPDFILEDIQHIKVNFQS